MLSPRVLRSNLFWDAKDLQEFCINNTLFNFFEIGEILCSNTKNILYVIFLFLEEQERCERVLLPSGYKSHYLSSTLDFGVNFLCE